MKKNFTLTLIAIYSVFLALAVPLLAADPAWWTTGNTTFIDANATANTTANYLPLNVGQLKNVASKAETYLNTELSLVGGSSPAIAGLVNGFSANTAIDYQPANLGQLKAVASTFYDQMVGIGYNTTANLITRGGWGNWTASDYYAWNPGTSTQGNYVLSNIGQLKMVFSFDLSTYVTQDSNSDGIPDYKAIFLGMNPYIAGGDTDGDGHADTTDVFPLDPAFSVIPANTTTDVGGPQITLVGPVNVTLISSH